MGLTVRACGRGAVDSGLTVCRTNPDDRIVALAGNPNVGKSTVFNGLTGLRQHTGNWPGKTVSGASGSFSTPAHTYLTVDLPGTYSLLAHSPEEEVARDFLCAGEADAVVVVCDASVLGRSLNLVLQADELTPGRVIVCLNLMDEAARRGITPDTGALSRALGMPVVAMTARRRRELAALPDALDVFFSAPSPCDRPPLIRYPAPIEEALQILVPVVSRLCGDRLQGVSPRWAALRLLDREAPRPACLADVDHPELQAALTQAAARLAADGLTGSALTDVIVTTITRTAEQISESAAPRSSGGYSPADRRLDRWLTGRRTAFPLMLLLLLGIFWLTIEGANYPSALLSRLLFGLEVPLASLFDALGAPIWLRAAAVEGVYRTLAWVVSVMLPPMAIFFPLFTLLEDAGYLPRVAYNLDRPFRACRACGKQALCMCMGFGCNAAGVVGCRIIDSPRERLLAVLTNSLVPCNGRFPTLIALITVFFVGVGGGLLSSAGAALGLTALILLAVLATFAVTRLLSATLLRGMPSSFTLELPPYRPPQIGQVIVRSIFDRTLFVLGRAAAVAAPAGLLIWILANVSVGETSLLGHAAALLDPLGRLMGMDGVILLGFILGFPANEIVIPVITMAYLAEGALLEPASLVEMQALFTANGWTQTTALCVMLFSLFHWPCSTTLWTIRRETGSLRWTALAALIPTLLGALFCILVNLLAGLF